MSVEDNGEPDTEAGTIGDKGRPGYGDIMVRAQGEIRNEDTMTRDTAVQEASYIIHGIRKLGHCNMVCNFIILTFRMHRGS